MDGKEAEGCRCLSLNIKKEEREMRRSTKRVALSLFLAVCVSLSFFTIVCAQEYDALKGLKSAKAVFDVRIGNPKGAALQLQVIRQSYKDLAAKKLKPAFAVVFIGPSVKLISKKREGFAAEDQKKLDEIAGTISQLSQDGIKLEVCLIAAKVLGVDPASILPEIKKVPNGYISVIGYQAHGYSLVPVY
jgi:intracellular sulfur oxidation DsrE/DsrF family protein